MRSWLVLLMACGGPAAHSPKAIALEPTIALQSWYRSPARCAQGPYEIEVPIAAARWGEDVELRVHTPRRIALHAVILADDKEVERVAAVFDDRGDVANGKPDNARCVADARERLALGRTMSPGPSGGAPTATAPTTSTTPDASPTATAMLQPDPDLPSSSTQVLRFHLTSASPRVRARLWSIEPNDLTGVTFGVVRIEWKPNVPDAEYEAHVAELERAAEARRAERLRVEQTEHVEAHATVVVQFDAAAEAEAEARAEAASRRAEIEAALEIERRRRREQFCAAHREDRDCWGAGGFKVHAELEQRRHEREQYCAANTEDARCWSTSETIRRHDIWQARIDAALAPPRQPDGPPPAALAETIPPKLSMHADWRPGYWQWAETKWIWLGGMWRVPESDIVAEQTTTAPSAPPEARVEVAPAAPIRTAVWIAGFWQWSGSGWVWIAGSWQLRPEPRLHWRAAVWQPRGRAHVLIPGAWVQP